MAHLTLSLLGPFHVTLNNRTVSSFAYDKVRALLAYLAVEADRPHRREALAEFLWPDQSSATARHSLSQALTMLRQAIGDHAATPPYLLTTRESVQFNVASDYVVDVTTVVKLIDGCNRHTHPRRETCTSCARHLEAAVALYRDTFLAQFTIGDSAAFEEWALLRRDWLQQRVLDALAWLGEYHMERGSYAQATEYVERRITLDPWREDAHRQLMRVRTLSGQRAAALRHYEQCRTMLADELGIEPDAATTALYEQIRAGELSIEDAANTRIDPAISQASMRHTPLLVPITPFVGREHDVAAITALLSDTTCRLMTLIGPGGIGKTRLAEQIGRAQVEVFAHGVCFVSLAPIRSSQQIVAAIADALQFQFFGQDDPLAQLCAVLHSKQMLLVLDNFEHVLDGAEIVTGILQTAPDIKILATSRERLNLHGEWVYEVEGLSVPAQDALDALEDYSAVQLFVQSARRVQSRFELTTDDRRCVARICQLAGGMPLAIELAAAWVMVLPCAEIAREIEQSFDFLATSARDLPERHRSMRAVFDNSWRLLPERERSVFRRISVFRGGLTRSAAEVVADASLPSLAALVAKSLLHRTPNGRYEIHELLRQYGAARLHEIAEDEQQTRARHAAWYSEFLAQCANRLKGRDQQVAIKEIIDEMENIRVAWDWMTEQCDVALLARSFHGLWLFFASHGNTSEAGSLFAQTIARLERLNSLDPARLNARNHLLARLYSGFAPMHYRLGHVERARSLLEQSLATFRSIHAPRDQAFALHHLAATLHLQGAYHEEQALLHESIALSEAEGDHWLTGYSRNDLGLCTHLLGDDHAARRFCTDSFVIFKALDDRRGIAFALNNLGVIAAAQGEYSKAERLHRESLALRHDIDDRWGIAMSLFQLGTVLRADGQFDDSRARLLDALRAAYEIRALPVALDILVELAHLLIIAGDHGQARTLLGAAMQHPALTLETRHKAEQIVTDGLDQAASASIDSLITTLLTFITIPVPNP